MIAIAEGARDVEAAELAAAESLIEQAGTPEGKAAAKKHRAAVLAAYQGNANALAEKLETATGLESRVTVLGYV